MILLLTDAVPTAFASTKSVSFILSRLKPLLCRLLLSMDQMAWVEDNPNNCMELTASLWDLPMVKANHISTLHLDNIRRSHIPLLGHRRMRSNRDHLRAKDILQLLMEKIKM